DSYRRSDRFARLQKPLGDAPHRATCPRDAAACATAALLVLGVTGDVRVEGHSELLIAAICPATTDQARGQCRGALMGFLGSDGGHRCFSRLISEPGSPARSKMSLKPAELCRKVLKRDKLRGCRGSDLLLVRFFSIPRPERSCATARRCPSVIAPFACWSPFSVARARC